MCQEKLFYKKNLSKVNSVLKEYGDSPEDVKYRVYDILMESLSMYDKAHVKIYFFTDAEREVVLRMDDMTTMLLNVYKETFSWSQYFDYEAAGLIRDYGKGWAEFLYMEPTEDDVTESISLECFIKNIQAQHSKAV